jgi:uncharacterized protein (DUF2342 family)
MTRPLASYLEPWIADGDPLPDTVTVNAADLLAAVGELRRMEAERDELRDFLNAIANGSQCGDTCENERIARRGLNRADALAPADG